MVDREEVEVQLLPKYFKTLGESLVNRKIPSAGINPATFQSIPTVLNHSAN